MHCDLEERSSVHCNSQKNHILGATSEPHPVEFDLESSGGPIQKKVTTIYIKHIEEIPFSYVTLYNISNLVVCTYFQLLIQPKSLIAFNTDIG